MNNLEEEECQAQTPPATMFRAMRNSFHLSKELSQPKEQHYFSEKVVRCPSPGAPAECVNSTPCHPRLAALSPFRLCAFTILSAARGHGEPSSGAARF